MSQINGENQPIFSWIARHSDVGSRTGTSTGCEATLSTGTGEFPTTLLTMRAVRSLGDCACDALSTIGRPSGSSMIQQGSGFGEDIAAKRVIGFQDAHVRATEMVTTSHPRLAELAPVIAGLVMPDSGDDQLHEGAYNVLVGELTHSNDTAVTLPVTATGETR